MSSVAITSSKIKDAACVSERFAGHTLPRLHSLSDQTQSEAMILPFIQAAQSVAREGAAGLQTERQRSLYLNLCQCGDSEIRAIHSFQNHHTNSIS